jgi:hypothetical protein
MRPPWDFAPRQGVQTLQGVQHPHLPAHLTRSAALAGQGGGAHATARSQDIARRAQKRASCMGAPKPRGDNRRADEVPQPKAPATAVRALAASGPQPGDHTHTRRCAAAETGAPQRRAAPPPPLTPSSSGPMAPAPHKLCATACAMRHTQKDTAPRFPRRPTRAHGGPRLANATHTRCTPLDSALALHL